jgi:SNF2-related domain
MTEIITDYHSKYLASDLVRRRSSDSSEKLAVAVAGAQVDMNPHQVDAALFAFASPLSKGALLADEVGLGKTIEAGLVISQRWAEGKRRILIIAPSNLRKQWHQEMNEKFFIPWTIIESKPYNAEVKAGNYLQTGRHHECRINTREGSRPDPTQRHRGVNRTPSLNVRPGLESRICGRIAGELHYKCGMIFNQKK